MQEKKISKFKMYCITHGVMLTKLSKAVDIPYMQLYNYARYGLETADESIINTLTSFFGCDRCDILEE